MVLVHLPHESCTAIAVGICMASFDSRSCGAELTQASEVVWGDLVSDP